MAGLAPRLGHDVREPRFTTDGSQDPQRDRVRVGHYLLIVTLINVCVGALTGVICALTGTPNAIGFGALAAALNFIPIIGPIATFVVLLLVGVVTAPTFARWPAPGGRLRLC